MLAYLVLAVSTLRTASLEVSSARKASPLRQALEAAAVDAKSLERPKDSAALLQVEGQEAVAAKAAAKTQVSPRHHIGPSLTVPGHLLTQSELDNITSVGCLEAKQQDAAIVCDENGEIRLSTNVFRGEVSPANYPNYTDPACYASGDFLCDTRPLLTEKEHRDLESLMASLRSQVPVNCGILTRDPTDTIHKQPFYLGVALLDHWPLSALDPGSMDAFGQRVASQWNMAEKWVGETRHRSSCPNEAMLLIAPDHRQAYLSSVSCEFICAQRGGPEVVTATLVNLENVGIASAIEAGIKQVYHILQEVAPQSEVLNKEPQDASRASREATDTLFNIAQQALFVLMIAALAGSFVVGFLVLLLAPGYIRHLGKY